MKRLTVAGAAVLAICILLSASLIAQQAVVKKNVNLRPTPSTEQQSKRLLKPPEALTLVVPNPTEGYYHVLTSQNEDGWVWGRNITFVTGASSTTNLLAAPEPDEPVLPPGGSYAISKASCPPVGKHKKKGVLFLNSETSNSGMLSMAKRHIPSGSARTLTFDDFRSLQSATSKALSYDARAHDIKIEDSRDKLQNLNVSSGTISEGDHVRIAGYVTEANKQGPEAVNCYDPSQNDIHINVAPKDRSREDGIVAETIPQLDNPPEWKESTFKKLQKLKLQVLVVGGLTYDNEHRINDDLKNPIKGGEPWRFSLWEIHPVTKFYVCASGTCNTANIGEWTTLSAWAKTQK